MKRAGEKLGKEVTVGEILEQMKEMSDGAAGKDDVTIGMIRKCNPETQILMAEKIKQMAGRNPDEWENTIKEGVVITLHKNKGKRDQMNNYRGICLLSMASRILASFLASRIRDWSEETSLLDENQQGFRAGRSTANSGENARGADK